MIDPPTPSTGKNQSSRTFQVVVATLIALVSVIGALIAWRAAVLSEQAANADFAGTVTVIRREDARTTAAAAAYGRYRAFTDYVIYQTIADTLPDDDPALEADRAAANNVAFNNRLYFDVTYLRPGNTYDLNADIAATVGDANLRTPLDPVGNFSQADATRSHVRLLVADFILLAAALLCFTSAEALYVRRYVLRYGLLGLGLVLMVGGVAIAIYAEVGL